MRNARLDETQAGIKIAGRNNNNLRYADDTTLMAENEEKLKSPLIKMKTHKVYRKKELHSNEKEYIKAVYCHPAYLTYMQSTS